MSEKKDECLNFLHGAPSTGRKDEGQVTPGCGKWQPLDIVPGRRKFTTVVDKRLSIVGRGWTLTAARGGALAARCACACGFGWQTSGGEDRQQRPGLRVLDWRLDIRTSQLLGLQELLEVLAGLVERYCGLGVVVGGDGRLGLCSSRGSALHVNLVWLDCPLEEKKTFVPHYCTNLI